MRILYIGKHDQTLSNDDEGSITHALVQLGHDVQRLREIKDKYAYRMKDECDVVLFHKWDNVAMLEHLKNSGMKSVFWYFDLVEWAGDPTIERRCNNRRDWMHRILPHTDLGFCTDGDWVNKDTTGKLIRLTQGADNRITGYGQEPVAETPAILFSGTSNGGIKRRSFVDEMQITYKQTFNCVTNGVYGNDLANLIAGSKICVAPDSPVTDQYWSNRVYITCGFGGFLLHPYCKTLAEQYEHGKEIGFYHSREELHGRIQYYYKHQEEARQIGDNALRRTLRDHTYLHRCAEMMAIVERRLFNG